MLKCKPQGLKYQGNLIPNFIKHEGYLWDDNVKV